MEKCVKYDSFFNGYEAIVYSGWFMAEKVAKVNWFLDKGKDWKDKRLAVVAYLQRAMSA